MTEQQLAAMRQALEALEHIHKTGDTQVFDLCYANKVIPALRAAIEQAETAQGQEPVAWATMLGSYSHVSWGKDRPDYPIRYEVPLYTTPPAAQPAPVQKPVEHLIAAFRALAPHCTMHDIIRFREVCRNVLATPPAAQPAEWKGLTDDDYEGLLKTRDWGVYLIEAVEAKLKEKNT